MARMPIEPGGAVAAMLSLAALWAMVWQGARQAYPDGKPLDLVRRARYGWRAWRRRQEWKPLREAAPDSPLGQRVQERSGLAHMLAWPYLHCGWTVRERVDTLVWHYRQLEQWPWLQVPADRRLLLARLPVAGEALSIQLERPHWFAQEGELTLSLFDADTRLYSVVFSFGRRQGRTVAYVGAIQGRSLPGINERYAELTRLLEGCRPRDLVLLALQFVAEVLAVDQLLAVSDACRHHRDPARWRRLDLPSADYDTIWRDRGGTPTADGFFAIDTGYAPRPLDTVPARKRAMYRRRQDMLGRLRDDIHGLARAEVPPQALPADSAH
jgi:uncharacterized protein VirK/YbjX